MRRILIEQTRRKHTQKMGGQRQRVDLDEGLLVVANELADRDDLLALDEALTLLEAEDPSKRSWSNCAYFGGLTLDDTAQTLGISVATAKRHWVYARAWLYGKVAGT